MQDIDPDVLAITETHLDSSVVDSEFIDTSKFTVYRRDRTQGLGGGVAMVVKNEYVPYVNLVYEQEDIIALIFEYKGKTLELCCFYRRPSLNNFQGLIDYFTNRGGIAKNRQWVILGDFNLPGIAWKTQTTLYNHGINSFFIDTIREQNLSQMVTESTHIKGNVLDLILTNDAKCIKKMQIIPGLSDHYAVDLEIQNMFYIIEKLPRPGLRKHYIMHKANEPEITKDLGALKKQVDSMVTLETDIDNIWDVINTGILTTCNANIPTKVHSGKRKNWMTRDILHLVRRKKRAFREWKCNNGDYNTYMKLNKIVKNKIRWAKNIFMNTHLEKQLSSGNSRPFYKHIAQKRGGTGKTVALKDLNGTLTKNNTDMANIFNSAFVSVFTIDDGSMPPHNESRKYVTSPPTITEVGIEKLMAQLNISKAVGPDGIPNIFLRSFSRLISPIMHTFFVYSLSTAKVPSEWRRSNICPIYKKGSATDPLNYRPIALTSVTCKQMEHIVAKHIRNHLEEHSLLVEEQHGFRSRRSCETQLITTIHHIASFLEQNIPVVAVILDFSKAFDKVSHVKLLLKLEHYGIDGFIVNWIASWLKERKQIVVVDGDMSDEALVTSGVPQGSVLGPLLFIIFINDITESCKNNIRLFADDALLFGPALTNKQISAIQDDLDSLFDWSVKWQMEFNPKKCEVINFSCPSMALTSYNYHLNGIILTSVQDTKYLGVTISSNLNWNKHIQNTIKKATGLLAMLQRQIRCCSTKTKLTMYKTIVRPTLDYASCVWTPHLKYNIKDLEKVQRRAARWIGGLKGDESVTAEMSKLGLETLEERRLGRDRKVMLDIQSGGLEINIDDHMIINPYNTRNRHVQQSAHTQPFYHSFFIRSLRNP